MQVLPVGLRFVVVVDNKLRAAVEAAEAQCTTLCRPYRGFAEFVGLGLFLFRGVVRFNVREQTALRADTPRNSYPPAAPHPSLVALGLCIRRRSYEFRMILFLLLAEDHEQDGGNADDDAGEDVHRQRFAKDQRADQDCRYGFESAQDGGLRWTDKACGKGYRQHGYHSREDCQTDEIQYVRSGVNALQHRRSVNKQVCQKSDSAYHQTIEREHMLGDMFNTLRAVDDHQIDGITQSGHRRENNAEPVNLCSGGGPTEQDHSRNRGGYRQPYLPLGIDMQPDHDKRYKDRIQIDESRCQPQRLQV